MKILLTLLTFMLAILRVAFAQDSYNITGTVTDAFNNQPLAGTQVQIQNTSLGTITDIDGNYKFTADLPSGQYNLVFSFIGYKKVSQPITLANQTTITQDVALREDLLNLDEVVVTGSPGATTKKQLGNSVSTVSSDAIKKSGTNNVLAALSGKVLGAQVNQNSGDPGGGISVRLRGASTINGSSEPLYIVDGVIVDNSSQNVINLNADAQGTNFQAGQNRLVDINPNDIDHIEILNGAAAAAIYGSRASNGVVQIFTKRGKEGKPKVTLQTAFSVSELRKRIEFNDFPERFGFRGDERLSTTGDRLTMIADLRSAEDRETMPGTGPPALAGRPLVENTYAVDRFDYQDNIFQTALGTDNYLSVSGGSDNTQYYASISYNFNEGIIRNTSFEQYSVKARIDQRFSDWLKVSGGLNYINSESEDKPNGNNFFSPISTMIIIDNVWDITERDEFGI